MYGIDEWKFTVTGDIDDNSGKPLNLYCEVGVNKADFPSNFVLILYIQIL